MKLIFIPALIIIFSITSVSLSANHLLGGEFILTCEAVGDYSVVFQIERECEADGAPFDDPLFFTVYRTLFGNIESYLFFDEVPTPSWPGSSQLANCLDTSSVCLEKTEYSFEVSLPLSEGSYFLVYQRCCTVDGIVNMVDSMIGFSYVFELTTEARSLCNNNPIFSNAHFLEVCKGEAFSFDMHATDVDGDSLSYALCSPLSGAGPIGSPAYPGNPSDCDGLQPMSSCPPPYDAIPYLPGFTAEQPLGATSTLELNPSTGIISGVAQNGGRYITALCVSEYRNGVLLSNQHMAVLISVFDPDAVSTSEVDQKAMQIFPNPATMQVEILLAEDIKDYELFVRDITGRMVHQTKGIDPSISLTVAEWNKGLYFLEIKTNKGSRFCKFMVE